MHPLAVGGLVVALVWTALRSLRPRALGEKYLQWAMASSSGSPLVCLVGSPLQIVEALRGLGLMLPGSLPIAPGTTSAPLGADSAIGGAPAESDAVAPGTSTTQLQEKGPACPSPIGVDPTMEVAGPTSLKDEVSVETPIPVHNVQGDLAGSRGCHGADGLPCGSIGGGQGSHASALGGIKCYGGLSGSGSMVHQCDVLGDALCEEFFIGDHEEPRLRRKLKASVSDESDATTAAPVSVPLWGGASPLAEHFDASDDGCCSDWEEGAAAALLDPGGDKPAALTVPGGYSHCESYAKALSLGQALQLIVTAQGQANRAEAAARANPCPETLALAAEARARVASAFAQADARCSDLPVSSSLHFGKDS